MIRIIKFIYIIRLTVILRLKCFIISYHSSHETSGFWFPLVLFFFSHIRNTIVKFTMIVAVLHGVWWIFIIWRFLIVCSYHVTFAFQRESKLYSCLNVKELLARSWCHIWSLSDCNGTRTHNHLVRKRTLTHLVKLDSLAKWLSVRLRTKWLWVQVPL